MMRTIAFVAIISSTVLNAGEAVRVPVFEAETRLINLTVSVTGKPGVATDNLTASNFIIHENGVLQHIELFERQTLPIDLVLLLDVSGSMSVTLEKAQHAALQFVRTQRPQDRTMVASFAERLDIRQDFTNDYALLGSALSSLRIGGWTRLHAALYCIFKEVLPKNTDREHPRRQVIILLTDGEESKYSDGNEIVTVNTDDQIIALARTKDAAIYAIQLPSSSAGIRKTDAARYLLAKLAEGTGGSLNILHSLSDMHGAYDQIAQELRMQYRIGYRPTNKRNDGTWRTISVAIAGRSGVQARHRSGYVAPKQ